MVQYLNDSVGPTLNVSTIKTQVSLLTLFISHFSVSLSPKINLNSSVSLSRYQMADEYDLAIFASCTPICSDVSADPELEALQAELKRRKLGSADDQSNNNPDEAQSALSALPESNPAEGTSGIPPPVDQPPTETAPAQRKRRGRPPKTEPVANPNEVERPSWLPLGWFVVRRTRQNGRSAGHKDKVMNLMNYIEMQKHQNNFWNQD